MIAPLVASIRRTSASEEVVSLTLDEPFHKPDHQPELSPVLVLAVVPVTLTLGVCSKPLLSSKILLQSIDP
jgi:hypothetical protein